MTDEQKCMNEAREFDGLPLTEPIDYGVHLIISVDTGEYVIIENPNGYTAISYKYDNRDQANQDLLTMLLNEAK